MHGPCHVLTLYYSSEELWLLLFVSKYRKIEFHKNMHSPWKVKGFSRYNETLQRDEHVDCCGPSHVGVCVCVWMAFMSHTVHVECNTEECRGARGVLYLFMCAYVRSVTVGVNLRWDEEKKKNSLCKTEWTCRVSLQKIFPFFLFFSIVLYEKQGRWEQYFIILHNKNSTIIEYTAVVISCNRKPLPNAH